MKLNYHKSKNPPTQHLRSVWHKATLLMCCFIFLIGKQSIASPILLLEKFDAEIGIQESVTGTITDNTGMPLPGVNVQVKNTDRGTITNFDGKYTIIANGDDTLIISFVGFETQEISVEGRTSIDVSLLEDVGALDEVVVVGYGTQSKRNVTGAITSIQMSYSENQVDVTESLTGVAGVQFNQTGRPGEVGNILIRGQNSLSGDNNPLIVLDGIIFNGNLNDINPQDIQSMEVLKDASSTAIYGSRASNGVILVTSKKGVTQKPAITLSAFHGISDWQSKLNLLSPERYLQRRLDWREQTGLESNPANIADYITPTEAENYRQGISRNPWEEISQPGRSNSLNMSVSARSEFTNYFLSASLLQDEGLIFNDNQNRSTFRVNLDSKITDWLNLGVNATFSHRDLSGINADVSDAYRMSPFGTYYYEDGHPTEFPVAEEQAGNNPMRAALLTDNEEIYANLFSNFYAQIDVPFLTGLSYRINFSPSYNWNHNYSFFRQDEHVNFNSTSASKLNQTQFNWVLENIVSYEQSIGEDHDFDLTLLYGINHNEFESTLATANQFPVDVLGYNNMGLGSNPTNSSSAREIDGVSYMARLNYQFMNRYLLTLTARKDGSSVFSANNKYATFPSGALGWIASEEPFLKDVDFVNMIKLRASYGSVGNQAIEPYQSLTLSGTERTVYGEDGSFLGVVTSTLGNEDLTWETTYMANLGLDFDLFDRRIGGSIDLYHSRTEDLLVRQTIPIMNGYNDILTNIGRVDNKGLEVVLNTVNITGDRFQWNSNFTFSTNKNKIVHLFGTDLNEDGREDDNIANSWFIGKPIVSFYDYVFDGIYQEGETNIPSGYVPGDVRVRDLNGDGVINAADRTVVGSGGSPEYQFSMRNTFTYSNFSLSVFINAMKGWEAPFNLINPLVPGRSLGGLDAGWWTSENRSNTRPALTYTNPLKTNWYISRDFIRIQDIVLSYDFKIETLERLRMSNLRLYVSGKNLYTFTDWLGTDPESGGHYLSAQGSDDLYPMPRTFIFGVNISF